MDAWLAEAQKAIAEAAGIPDDELTVEDEEAATILDLARIAAHVSGDRTNAPLLCFLVGRAVERGASLETIAAALRS